jgi:hypothetical protein
MIPARIKQWWVYLVPAADACRLDSYFLAAICDRESLGGIVLEPPGPGGTGDNGFGLGLMQIDMRYNQEFALRQGPSGLYSWQDPQQNINYGATLLAQRMRRFEQELLPASISRPDDLPIALMAMTAAAYNANQDKVSAAVANITSPATLESIIDAIDALTTGGNYASDVLERRTRFMSPTTPPSAPPPAKP